jgi:hypothetical protein
MLPLALFCKSYSVDLKRLVRLAQSVHQFNIEKIPFYVSVPPSETQLFEEHLAGMDVQLIPDSLIIEHNPHIKQTDFDLLPGNLAQQIVKSEFWRLGVSRSYLCLDSDAVFIRDFRTQDYLYDGDIPYTVINEAHDLLGDALSRNKPEILRNFHKEAAQLQELLGRTGKVYSFGPMPMVWHREVWASLETHYLSPQRMNFLDAIRLAPLESRWYGEALLKFGAVPLIPSEPFFKVYHYGWQLDHDNKNGVQVAKLAHLFSGVIYQSSWDRAMDWPVEGGHAASKLARRFRRAIGRA